MRFVLMVCGLLLLVGQAAASDVKEEAHAAILRHFDPVDCPAVLSARKLPDGSIDTLCRNGETFRVSSFVVMRCSAAAAIGVTGCSDWGVDPARVRAITEEQDMLARCRADSASCTRQELQQVNEILRNIGMDAMPVPEPQPHHDPGAIGLCPPPHKMTRDGCQ
jgi:hypothetical protein